MVGGLVLHEYCRSGLQCTGTENAEKCNTDEHHTQGTCICNDDYIEIGSKCYKSKIYTINTIRTVSLVITMELLWFILWLLIT